MNGIIRHNIAMTNLTMTIEKFNESVDPDGTVRQDYLATQTLHYTEHPELEAIFNNLASILP